MLVRPLARLWRQQGRVAFQCCRSESTAAPATKPQFAESAGRQLPLSPSTSSSTATSATPASNKGVRKDRVLTADQLRRAGERKLLLDERKNKRRALDALGVPSFDDFLASRNLPPLRRRQPNTLQVNVGLYCNQACGHCHVESSPQRTEMMDERTARRLVQLLESSPEITTVDLTGGAPELNSQFRFLVREAHRLGKTIIDRCNLTVLYEPGQADLVEFLKAHKVQIVASLPCYSAKNVDQQRGDGVFDKSIRALQDLNKAGYGQPNTGLGLDLVYNPVGAFLPPGQQKLEVQYKKELASEFGITFTRLLTITNMPIKRFADYLHKENQLQSYMNLLVTNFNPATCADLMCRDIINVSWDGKIYDCDFNQMLQIEAGAGDSVKTVKDIPDGTQDSNVSVFDVSSLRQFTGAKIATDAHCFGCTAGSGSSCGGSLL